jgi:hypothetical protein
VHLTDPAGEATAVPSALSLAIGWSAIVALRPSVIGEAGPQHEREDERWHDRHLAPYENHGGDQDQSQSSEHDAVRGCEPSDREPSALAGGSFSALAADPCRKKGR